MDVIPIEIVNATEEPTILTIVIIAVIIAVGIILFAIGLYRGKPSPPDASAPTPSERAQKLKYGGIAVILFGALMFFLESTQLREHMVALAVVIAATISAISLDVSTKLKRENTILQTKERLGTGIGRISDWAIRVVEHLHIPSRFMEDTQVLKARIMDCRAELSIDAASGIGMLAIAKELSSNDQVSASDQAQLTVAMAKVDKLLRSHVTLLFDTNLDAITVASATAIIQEAANLIEELKELLTISSHIAFV